MAKLLDFTITNFKGIESLTIDLNKRNKAPVLTLVGLNESGKTTILEALSHFVSVDNLVSNIFTGIHAKSDPSSLIPIHKRGNFTGSISISATFAWDEQDKAGVVELFSDANLDLSTDSLGATFIVKRNYQFKDSLLVDNRNFWTINLSFRPRPMRKTRGKPIPYKEYERPKDQKDDLWLKCVGLLGQRVPKIVYFPTFLVDIPTQIYLKPLPDETPVNTYYRTIIQEILSSIDPTLSIETHINNRIKSFKESQDNPLWWSIFFGTPTKRNVDSVIQRLSAAVTKEVIGSWSAVFQRPSGAKSVQIEWNVDTQKDDTPYISFYVSDGDSLYLVSERSLGFRWFFSFLLFTAFKEGQSRPTLFLFDEPAANLHAKAQAELLKNFGRIATGGNRVIYSTHSHHMIEPRWLSSAYIVENKSIDYDSTDSFELTSKPTNIDATPYRQFVSNYPKRTSYFQPVIEKLEYVSPEIIGSPPFLLLEGITDYYAFSIVKNKHSDKFSSFSLIPGSGAGSSASLISYLTGRGESFIIILDDDAAGNKAKANYLNGFFLSERFVTTLAGLSAAMKGKKLETLLSSDTIELIKAKGGFHKQPSKKEIGLFLAECCASGDNSIIGGETEKSILSVLEQARLRLS